MGMTQALVKKDFEKLFYTVYPDGCSPANKAQFMAFFWGGYSTCHGDFIRYAQIKSNITEALKIVAEKATIAKDRCKFIAGKIAIGDYSHKMFN